MTRCMAGFALLVALAAPVLAADPVPLRQPALLAAADADHDGKLTAAELHADRERQVAQYDADRDGRLSPEEYQTWWLAMARPRLARQFNADDRDRDGSVTLEELVARSNAMLHRRDANSDGMLTAEELRPRRRPNGGGSSAAGVSGRSVPPAGSG